MPAEVLYRCGVTANPQARGVLSRWGLKEVTYSIETALTGANFSATDYAAIVAEAFAEFPRVCGLRFRPANAGEHVNLVIGAGRGRRAGFDGRSGVLAWCELPPSDGFKGQLRLMMDQEEIWAASRGSLPRSAILVVNVLRHEAGHGVGVSHHNAPNSLMNPTYSESIATFQPADIAELVDRYGQPTASPPAPPPPPPTGQRRKAVRLQDEDGTIFGGWVYPLPQNLTAADDWTF